MDATAQLTAALAGRYSIERELGEGGMATVYLAHDVKHARKGATAKRRDGQTARRPNSARRATANGV